MPATIKPADHKPVLRPGVLYLAGPNIVCASTRCAGSTALYSGRTIHGVRLSKVTRADIAEWATYGMGPMQCMCGSVTAE